jgi:hypothetical protein
MGIAINYWYEHPLPNSWVPLLFSRVLCAVWKLALGPGKACLVCETTCYRNMARRTAKYPKSYAKEVARVLNSWQLFATTRLAQSIWSLKTDPNTPSWPKKITFFSCHSYDNVSHCQCNICVCMLLFSNLSNWCQLYLFGNSILGYPTTWLVNSSHRQNHQIRVMYPWHHSIIYNSICSPWCFCFIQTFARMCDQLFTYLYDSIHLKSYIHVILFHTYVKYSHHFTYQKIWNM